MNKMSIDTCFNMGSCCVSLYYIRDMKSPWAFLPTARSDSNLYPVLNILKEIQISDLLTSATIVASSSFSFQHHTK